MQKQHRTPGAVSVFAVSSILVRASETGLIPGLKVCWFAIANRYVIFLYYHDMVPLMDDTTPFGRVTSSRYWMTGLVTGGLSKVRSDRRL